MIIRLTNKKSVSTKIDTLFFVGNDNLISLKMLHP